jgi:hypothetical protein
MKNMTSGEVAKWRSGQRGNAYIEYFVLALIVALATIAFWRGSNGFGRARASVESAFDASVNRILAP